MKKNRGVFLTITLVLFILIEAFGLYAAPTLNYQSTYQYVPSWLTTFTLINIFVDLLALIGVWLWKKMAVYVLIVSFVIPSLMELLVYRVAEAGLGDVLLGLVMYGFLFWSISRKWEYFE